MSLAIMEIDDLDKVLSHIVARYRLYLAHHSDVSTYGCALRLYSAKIDTLMNLFVQLYENDLITEETYIDCTKMIIEYNDELLSAYYDAVRG